MAVSKFVSPPGEKVSILAFNADLSTVQILDGYKRDGDLAINGFEQKGFNLSDCSSLIYKGRNGRPQGMIYPAIYEIAAGVRLFAIGKPRVKEAGAFINHFSKEVKIPTLKEPVKLSIPPLTVELRTDPRLIGKALDNALLKNILSLRAEIWQLIVALLFGLFVGAMAF